MLIIVGTTNVDLFLNDLPGIPAMEGDEFTVDNLVFCDTPLRAVLGGNGGNSAYAAARLGLPVVLCSAVGADLLGDTLAEWLAIAGVDLGALVRTTAAATSTTTILSDGARNRLSFHHRGASGRFDAVAIPEEALAPGHLLLIGSYPLLVGWRPGRVAQVLAAARAAGATTALDIGPAVDPPARLDELAPFLPDVDFFLCNAHELTTCADAPVDAAAQAVRARGAGTVVLKRGRDGARLYTGEGMVDVPGFPIEATSTVGAGDAFNAGFLGGLAMGLAPHEAARFGNAVAALTVRAARGGLGAPTGEEVAAFLLEKTKSG